MRHIHLASAIALLAACSTAGPNTGQSPTPGDSTVATRADTIRRDSAGARIRDTSTTTRTTDTTTAAARTRDTTIANRERRDSALGSGRPADSASAGGSGTPLRGSATMRSTSGADLGTLTVNDDGKALAIGGTLKGMPPGTHGIHLHMVGTCDAPAFTSAGDHWNPTGRQHGSQNPQGPHLGDLQNITVGADGSASVQLMVSNASLKGTNALIDTDGAAIVVHAAADDYRTDPSGNSGARLACGVVNTR